jgi:hypothetical protein
VTATPTASPLVLRFGGSLVEQLGAQLYPQVTASVAELVSNAWDADARNVWISIPFDEEWRRDGVIEVIDDGHGMTREQAQQKYLVVGRNRRREDGETSEGGRLLHGRKGIGKLAAFGTAGLLECVTLRDGVTTAFAIDYEALRKHPPTSDYVVEAVSDPEPLLRPDTGEPLERGTRVRLSRLRAKRRPSEAAFRRSMARRFALSAAQMRVFINGQALERFDYDVEIRFPRDGVPPGVTLDIDEDGWAREEIDYSAVDPDNPTREVRWWIGFTATPIADEDMRGISILSRGKLAQRPFMFEAAQGTTGQLGQEYLVGEVSADWIDHGVDADEDLIQSNRDQLQLDNAELGPLVDWGRDRLRWALAQRNRVRRAGRAGAEALGPAVEAVLQQAPTRSRERLRTLAARIADVTEADEKDVARAVEAVLQVSDVGVVRRAADELRLEGDPDVDQTWSLLSEAGEAAADAQGALLEARRDALEHFVVAIAEPPVARLHRAVSDDPWLLSPLLADVPRRVLHSNDALCVVEFAAQPPVLRSLVIACWAVGRTGGSLPKKVGEADVLVATKWETSTDGHLTWDEALRSSIAAHDALLSTLRRT